MSAAPFSLEPPPPAPPETPLPAVEAPAPETPPPPSPRRARVVPREIIEANRAAAVLDLSDGEEVADLLCALASDRAPCAFLACGVPDEARFYLVVRQVLAGGGSVVAIDPEPPSTTLLARLRECGSQQDVEDAADLFRRRSMTAARGPLTRWGSSVTWVQGGLADALSWHTAMRRNPAMGAPLFPRGVSLCFCPARAAVSVHRALRPILSPQAAYVLTNVAGGWLAAQAVAREASGAPVPEGWSGSDGETYAVIERRPAP